MKVILPGKLNLAVAPPLDHVGAIWTVFSTFVVGATWMHGYSWKRGVVLPSTARGDWHTAGQALAQF
jgi:hypothetical protein